MQKYNFVVKQFFLMTLLMMMRMMRIRMIMMILAVTQSIFKLGPPDFA